ncbi:Ppx/GppA phosphatase family protein [Campylobacter sp. 19-13652]|uniref:Ppx/GppA phosphatase family protein n=1 Tax=Campylobacter sp. 19-13652 TaxID=2840180 RepID=UPI001C744FC2|nr:Ppx/GppA phosphatase family protein [Campylobacter sp. 19-13652]BCX78963.1 phosphatase [Campylobacter sp. 19-13652]
MAKRTAVIDLGSNSMRLAIYERTSRWAFFTLAEFKTKVRLASGGYNSAGEISKASMQRAIDGFCEFAQIAKAHKCHKIYAVGTSALRDAPNSSELISAVKRECNINLKVIDGKMEAILGATAAANLLAPFKKGVTIDIGGGSTELALVENGRICKAISLNLGTVRLKELFFDNKNTANLKSFLADAIKGVIDDFRCENIIAIGGSLRALSSAIISRERYPISTLHNFEYKLSVHEEYLSSVANSTVLGLERLSIKKERFDTIREGAHIFLAVAKALGVKRVITSGVGVREGVFLNDFLGLYLNKRAEVKSGELGLMLAKFANGLNPGLKSLIDRFNVNPNRNIKNYAKAIFEALSPVHKLENCYIQELLTASKLINIGSNIGFYNDHKNSAYIVLNSLNYGYTHEQKALIAAIIGTNGKKSVYEYDKLEKLLPPAYVVRWLSFMLYLARALDISCAGAKLEFTYENQALSIIGGRGLSLAKDEIKKLAKPDTFAISFV